MPNTQMRKGASSVEADVPKAAPWSVTGQLKPRFVRLQSPLFMLDDSGLPAYSHTLNPCSQAIF